jgi:hypothetical protein
MAFIKQYTAPNGAVLSYHRITRIEISKDMDSYTATISSWPSEDQYLLGIPAIWNSYQTVSLDPTVLAEMSQPILDSGDFQGAQTVSDEGNTLDAIKARKKVEINAARLAANWTSFPYGGKDIACDQLSRGDIDGVNGWIAGLNSLPPGFPNAWKAIDNSYVPITDVATWYAFYGAMLAQGTANFAHSQTLKAQVDAATTEEEVEAIKW